MLARQNGTILAILDSRYLYVGVVTFNVGKLQPLRALSQVFLCETGDLADIGELLISLFCRDKERRRLDDVVLFGDSMSELDLFGIVQIGLKKRRDQPEAFQCFLILPALAEYFWFFHSIVTSLQDHYTGTAGVRRTKVGA